MAQESLSVRNQVPTCTQAPQARAEPDTKPGYLETWACRQGDAKQPVRRCRSLHPSSSKDLHLRPLQRPSRNHLHTASDLGEHRGCWFTSSSPCASSIHPPFSCTPLSSLPPPTPRPSARGAAATQSPLLVLALIASEVFEQDFGSFLPRSRANTVFVGGGVKNSSK